MQEFNLICSDDLRKIIMGKFQRMIASSNINLLLGSAFSVPYLQTLSNIEKRLSDAMQKGDKTEEYNIKKEFFEKSIAPVSSINFDDEAFNDKRGLIKTLADIMDLRETSVVHKIINIFTTNYDNLIETALEKNHIDYFDGFEGRIKPEFSTSNYGKLICRQTELSGRISESTSVNLFKLHGSIYWRQENDKIIFDDYQKLFSDISHSADQNVFLKNYEKLAIVNPEKNKFNSTVMNSNYYDQIRMFANELERQNTILLSFGFSFADEHIVQIISRALSSNPTLTLVLFPYCQKDLIYFQELFKFYNNVFCYYYQEEGEKEIKKFSLETLNFLLTEIYNAIK